MSTLLMIASKKTGARPEFGEAVGYAEHQGFEVDVRLTASADEVKHVLKEVAAQPDLVPDTIMAAGGDGTLNLVFGAACDAALQGRCSFGVFPLGTGNDLARTLGVSANDPEAAIDIIGQSERRPVDVGRLDDQYFFNAVTGGFGARITHETPRELKDALGGLAYLVSGVSRLGEFESSEGVFAAEGFEWEGRFVAMAIANGRFAGGGVALSRQASFDDGLLDLAIVPDPAEEFGKNSLGELLAGDNSTGPVIRVQSSWVTFNSDKALHISRDGEYLEAARFEAKLDDRPLLVHCGQTA